MNTPNPTDQTTILHYTSIWLPQTMTWLYNQCRFLPPSISNHILCEKTENLDQFNLPNIHSHSDANPLRVWWDKALRHSRIKRSLGFFDSMAKIENAKILHSHFGHIGWFNIELAESANLKHVVTFYGFDTNYLPRKIPKWVDRYKELFIKAEFFLCEGSHMASCLVKMGCPEEKIRVHHLGIPVDEIEYRPRKWTKGEPLRVLIASSFREKKGIPYALEALGCLKNELPLEITIIGDATKEDRYLKEKQKIFNVVDKYNLRPVCRFLGYQPHKILLEEAYKNHVFLAPSVTASDGDTEGGAPVTIIELMASGMPVISTNHCDIPQIVKHNITGLVTDERDVDGLLNQLNWLITHQDQWQPMLDAGRYHIEKEFNATIQGQNLALIYQELVE